MAAGDDYDPPVSTDCLFCKIVAGEIPSTVVYETDLTLAFRDINPKAPTHVVVIPKAHHTDAAALAEADPALAGAVLAAAGAVARSEGVDESGIGWSSTPDRGRADGVPRALPRARGPSGHLAAGLSAGRYRGTLWLKREVPLPSHDGVEMDETRSTRLERVVRQVQAQERIPAVSVAVHRADRPLWTFQVGTSGRDEEPLGLDTRFRMGSITKTFTAVLTLQCRDDGLLELDDPISAHLQVPAHGELTIRRLLSHTRACSGSRTARSGTRSDARREHGAD